MKKLIFLIVLAQVVNIFAQEWGQKSKRFGQYTLYCRVVTDTSTIDKADGNLYQYGDDLYIGIGSYLKKLASSTISGIASVPGLSDSLSSHFNLITALADSVDSLRADIGTGGGSGDFMKADFGDSLVNYDGYGVTITNNANIVVDTSAIVTQYDIVTLTSANITNGSIKSVDVDSVGNDGLVTNVTLAALGYLTTETGDISAVTAGNGLSGGGSSGAVTLSVDSSKFATTYDISLKQDADADLTDLADGTLSKSKVESSGNWDTAYGWGNHASAGYLTSETGDISAVTAGNGLSGGGSSGAVTLTVDSSLIATRYWVSTQGSGSGSDYADSARTSDGKFDFDKFLDSNGDIDTTGINDTQWQAYITNHGGGGSGDFLAADFGDSLVNYDGYGVTITNNANIVVDTAAVATQYDIVTLTSANITNGSIKSVDVDSVGNDGLVTNVTLAALGYLTTETGDISAVTAGNGLSGGGSSGAVTLSVDSSKFATTYDISLKQDADADLTDLADGTLSKSKVESSGNWDTAYGWGNHASAGYLTSETGDISAVTAGNGLSGGGSSGAVTLTIDSSKVATAYDIVTLTSANITNGSIKSVDVDSVGNDGLVTNVTLAALGYLTTETGDISAVTAGNGLTGGGTSGAVTLTVDSSKFATAYDIVTLTTSNITNGSLKSVDVDSVGNDGLVTNVTLAALGYLTGNQSISLSGDVTGSGTTSITTTIASNAVGSAEITNGSIKSVDVDSVGLDGLVTHAQIDTSFWGITINIDNPLGLSQDTLFIYQNETNDVITIKNVKIVSETDSCKIIVNELNSTGGGYSRVDSILNATASANRYWGSHTTLTHSFGVNNWLVIPRPTVDCNGISVTISGYMRRQD